MELVLGRLVRLGDLADLLADLGEALADLLVGQGLDLGFEARSPRRRSGWMRRSSRSLESTKRERNRMAGEV